MIVCYQFYNLMLYLYHSHIKDKGIKLIDQLQFNPLANNCKNISTLLNPVSLSKSIFTNSEAGLRGNLNQL